LAEDVSWDPKTQHEFLDIISSEADRLSVLVDELLDISRIEAGSLRLSKRSCDLRELVELGMQRASPSPGDRLQIDIPSQIPKLMADPQRIGAVLRNLIENAAKYSEDHSPIRVRAACHQGRVIVQVEDEGPGIPLESQERIFSSFYRVQNGLTREKPGAGLGLAICRGFVKAHGGEIWLEPRPQGTCVAFSLPLTEQPSSPHGET
jgi:signal transduction histidine kinase